MIGSFWIRCEKIFAVIQRRGVADGIGEINCCRPRFDFAAWVISFQEFNLRTARVFRRKLDIFYTYCSARV